MRGDRVVLRRGRARRGQIVARVGQGQGERGGAPGQRGVARPGGAQRQHLGQRLLLARGPDEQVGAQQPLGAPARARQLRDGRVEPAGARDLLDQAGTQLIVERGVAHPQARAPRPDWRCAAARRG